MSRRSAVESAMRDLEEIFVVNSRNTITDVGGVAGQVGGSPMRARQISNQLTANADDAVFLDNYLTQVLPPNIASAGTPGSSTNPAEPLGTIIAYHNGQGTDASTGRLTIDGDAVKGGYVAKTTISDLLGATPGAVKLNTRVSSPSTDNPSLGIVQINSPFLSLPTRNILPVALFCTSLPTIELSRSLPFVVVRVASPVSPLSGGKANTLSLGSYLAGPGHEFKPGQVEYDIATSTRSTRLPTGILVPAGSKAGEQSLFGMEMFTTPQTLFNANATVGSRGVPVLDKFRPLMSLESVSIRVTPAGHGAIAFKEATVNIKVHDRSRMQDVAQLLKPDQFGYNYIELEYGWAHPDDNTSNNPYAPFINAFRQRELYTVVSSNISMGDGGDVTISIRCALKGARDLLNLTPISDAWASTTKAEQIFKQISALIKTATSIDGTIPEEDIRYVETIRSLSIGGSAGRFAISADTLKSVAEYIDKLKNSTSDPTLGSLRQSLVDAFGEDGQGGEVKVVVDSARKTFNTKIDALSKSAELYELGKKGATPGLTSKLAADVKGQRTYMTFGKIVAGLFGSPLASGTFAEVQLFFYTFNSDAGAMNRRNIAEFPIEVSRMRTAFEEAIKADPKMPLVKMMRILVGLVSDASSPAYGLDTPPKLQPGQQETKAQVDARRTKNTASMKTYGCMTANFKKPIIEYMMDSIRIGDQPVLRVHFFDKRSTPNDEALFLLDMQFSGDGSQEILNLVKTLQAGDADTLSSSVLAEAEAAGIIKSSTATKDGKTTRSFSLNANSKILKQYIKRTVPSITYGTPGSVMSSFSLQSIDMQDFETALLIQAANGTRVPGQPDTSSPQNDMQVYPMNISVSMLGCPLIDYAQEFYIDMDTGTSLDNVYVVNGINHTISPGQFKTDLDLKLTRGTGASSAIDSKIRTLLKSIDDRNK